MGSGWLEASHSFPLVRSPENLQKSCLRALARLQRPTGALLCACFPLGMGEHLRGA